MDALSPMLRRTTRAVLAAVVFAMLVSTACWGKDGFLAAAVGGGLAWLDWSAVAWLLRWGAAAPLRRAGAAVVGLYAKNALWLGLAAWSGMGLGLLPDGLLLGLGAFVVGMAAGALLSLDSMRGLVATEG